MLMTACEQFLGKSESEIQSIALHTLEGHQRAIMGSMTVEVKWTDRIHKAIRYLFTNLGLSSAI
jgi:flotillin